MFSSYGVFLVASVFIGIFLIWRLIRAWDIDEEKSLDLTFLTIAGGFLGGRLIFIIEHLSFFLDSPLSTFLIYKQPGFSFWGGLLSAVFVLYYFSKRFKIDFYLAADLASVAFLGSLGFAYIKFPVPLFEVIFLLVVFILVWPMVKRFHIRGKIISLVIIAIGVIRFLEGYTFSFIMVVSGIAFFYKITRRNLFLDLRSLKKGCYKIFTDSSTRIHTRQKISKWCYNQKTSLFWKTRNMLGLPKKTLETIKKLLIRQQKEIEKNLEEAEKDDPVKGDSLAESSEPGTDSYIAETHGKTLVVEQELKKTGNSIKIALAKIGKGTYGGCESCGKPVGVKRLFAMPTARLCLDCSSKPQKRR